MKIAKTFVAAMLFTGISGAVSHAVAEDVLIVVEEPSTAGSYCHEKFPAIRQSTLDSDQPTLKDSSTGDIIDFYGPCDESPVGKDQVQDQKIEAQHRFENDYES